jgi:NAD(P)H-dependent flavin oxidoreductase YrpB (nitropropane dioxygenase family)
MPEGEVLHHRVLKNETTVKEMERLTKGEFPLKRIISGMFEGKKQMKLSWLQLLKAGFMSKKSEGGVGVMGQAHYGSLANLKRAMEDGEDIPSGVSVGMIVGDCNDIPTCAEIIERTIKEAESVFETMKVQFSD